MKRFTETEKWRDSWFQALSPDTKLVFAYMTDTCDCAGVWDPNHKLAEFSIGKRVDWSKVYAELGQKVRRLGNGKVFVISFVNFQYGELSETCPPHRKVLQSLKTHGISYPIDTLRLPLGVGINTPQEEEEEKEEYKEEGGSGELSLGDLFPAGLNTEAFRSAWADWKKHRSEIRAKLTPTSEKQQLKMLAEMGERRAIACIRHTIFKGWQGLKEPDAGTAHQYNQSSGAQKPILNEPRDWKAWLNHKRPDSAYSSGGTTEAHEWATIPRDVQAWITSEMRKDPL